jgi:hypothetical protein
LGTQAEPQMVKVNSNQQLEKVWELKELLKEYNNVFAWTYKDLKGIPLELGNIYLESNVIWSEEWTFDILENNHKSIQKYLDIFMNIFLDDFIAYNDMQTHLQKLKFESRDSLHHYWLWELYKHRI